MLDKSIPFDKLQEMKLEEMCEVINNDFNIDALKLMEAVQVEVDKIEDKTKPFEFLIIADAGNMGVGKLYLNYLLDKQFGPGVKVITRDELIAHIVAEREGLPQLIKNILYDADKALKQMPHLIFFDDKPKRYDKVFGQSFKSKKSRRGSWPSNKF